MKAHRQGLVVGKFCPLHHGHMHLIQAALDACEEVLVISYTKPEFDQCAPPTREAWIERLFPQVRRLVIDDAILLAECSRRGIDPLMPVPANDAPDALHREFTGWLCWALAETVVDAVFTSESYGDGFATTLSEYFSARTGRRVDVAHVSVNPARSTIPVSGSLVRSDPHAFRRFLDPIVYADFVGRICILGGESSGKTTLVEALARELDTICVPEVGRTYWEARGGHLVFDDMRAIAEAQVNLENELVQRARQWLVCNGSALTTACYSMVDYGRLDPVVQALAEREYTATFVCAPDFPFVQDGTRRDAAFRLHQHRWYLATLDRAGVSYVMLDGPLDQRVRRAGEWVRKKGRMSHDRHVQPTR